MQIFNDKKKRIGTLSGFKDREITTTLDSGDKELSFSYPAAGALVDLLKEEYYIQSNFSSDEEYISFLNTIKNRSTYKYDVNISKEDKILTLSTCTNVGKGRTVLHAKLIYRK